MKFSIFADLHHYPGVFMGGTAEDMRFIQQRAEEAGASFIIHAGDFTHGPHEFPDYVRLYNDGRIPSYHVLGNHDTDHTPLDETLRLYNMSAGHYFFDCEGYRFIACDPNYYRLGDEYIHFELRNYAAHHDKRDWMPPEQLAWLRETIDSSPHPCVLISHESFEREADGVQNQAEVRAIINEANRKRPHSVILCINGHYHRDNIRILDNVCYFDLNSASYDWVDREHFLYPDAYNKAFSLMKNTVVYNDPIHAVITLEGTTITIEGMESSMLMGFNREHTDNPVFDLMGRPVVPRVQSAKITLG